LFPVIFAVIFEESSIKYLVTLFLKKQLFNDRCLVVKI
jgi:hypothetical protein